MKLGRRRFAGFHRSLREHYGRPKQAFSPGSGHTIGQTIFGVTFEARGTLLERPLAQPMREYLLYLPAKYQVTPRLPVLVWIHGCEQTPEAFRDGTRILGFAEERGFAVLMPRQSRWANPYGCWNWFDPATQNGVGEAAIVLAQLREVRRRWKLDAKRTWVAGLSSGACLAACLCVHAPGEFKAAALVSGIACGASLNSRSALNVMKSEPQVDVTEIARRVSHQTKPPVLPALVIQGEADEVINPAHSMELVRQLLAVNGEHLRSGLLRAPDAYSRDSGGRAGDPRQVSHSKYFVGGHSRVEMLSVEGLAHAWSGGDASLPFNDAGPFDATRFIIDFLRQQVSSLLASKSFRGFTQH